MQKELAITSSVLQPTPYDSISESDFNKLQYEAGEMFDCMQTICSDTKMRKEIADSLDLTNNDGSPWATKDKINFVMLLDGYCCLKMAGGEIFKEDKRELGLMLLASKIISKSDFSVTYENRAMFYKTAVPSFKESFEYIVMGYNASKIDEGKSIIETIVEDVNPDAFNIYKNQVKRFTNALLNKFNMVPDNFKFMVFDTETGGTDEYFNDILQLSYQIINYSTKGIIKEVNHFFPWPEDKTRVQEGAINVNGLTEEVLATKQLSNRLDAIKIFYSDMKGCDVIVAHNGDFDKRFIIATAEREGYPEPRKGWKKMIDTMKSTTELCKLPPHPGRTGYKWPKLIELAEFLQITTDDINLHDSSADVELTKRCFMHLLEQGFYQL